VRLSTITNAHFRNLVMLFCSILILLINIACKKEEAPPAEISTLSKHVDEKVSTKKGDSTQLSTMVVEVNGIKLTQNEVDTKISSIMESIEGKYPSDKMEAFKINTRKRIIEDFITRTLLNQEIDKQNIVASDDEIKLALSEIEKKFPQGKTLEDTLKQSGLSMEEMVKNITFAVRVNKLFESQIKSDFTPSDEAVKKYYTEHKEQLDIPETVHARHILVKVDDKDNEKTRAEKMAKIKGIRKQLLEGADFGKLSKENSECPSGEKGGDLGTFPQGRMVKPFADAAFSQKVNEIGPVVQTQFGYHIIQVLEHNKAMQKSLEEVKDNITEILKNQEKQEIAKSYLAELRKKAKIVYGTTEDSEK